MDNSNKKLHYLPLQRSFEVTRGHQPSFANNFWSNRDRDVGLVSIRSSWPGESTDMQYDPFRSSRDLGLTWPEVKLWPWSFKVILYMVRRALTRQTRWYQIRCSIFKIKDFIVEKPFRKILEFLPLETPILTWAKKWPKWFRNDFSRDFERCLSFFSMATRSRDHGGGVQTPPPPSRRWKIQRPSRARVNNSAHESTSQYSSSVNWFDSTSFWNWFDSTHDSIRVFKKWIDSSSDSSGYEKCDSIRFMIQAKIIWFWFDSWFKSESFTSLVLTHNHSIGTTWIFAHWLIMVRSQNWLDLWSQISKLRDIQVVGIYDLMKRWKFGTNRISGMTQCFGTNMWPLRSLKVSKPFWPDLVTWPLVTWGSNFYTGCLIQLTSCRSKKKFRFIFLKR